MPTKREKLEVIVQTFNETNGTSLRVSQEKFHTGMEYFVFTRNTRHKVELENLFEASGFLVEKKYQGGVNITTAACIKFMAT